MTTARAIEQTLAETFRRYRDTGLFTHAVAAYGRLDEAEPVFVFKDFPDARDVFDLASITKAFVTTTLVFREIAAGRLQIEATIGAWLGDKARVCGASKAPVRLMPDSHKRDV